MLKSAAFSYGAISDEAESKRFLLPSLRSSRWVHFSFGGRGGIIRENDRLEDVNEYWS
jgi:hypothetical protein